MEDSLGSPQSGGFAGHVFFKVVNTQPSRRVRVQVGHEQHDQCGVAIEAYGDPLRVEGDSVQLMSSCSYQVLVIRRWCVPDVFARVIASLMHWPVMHGQRQLQLPALPMPSRPSWRHPPAGDGPRLALGDASPASAELPSGSEDERLHEDAGGIMCEPHLDDAGMRDSAMPRAVGSTVLAMLGLNVVVGVSPGRSILDLPGTSTDAIQLLCRAGVLASRVNEFGEVTYAMEPDQLRWSLDLRCSGGALEVHRAREVRNMFQYAKLELLRFLFMTGWSRSPARQRGTKLGKPLMFHVQSACKSKAHLVALAQHQYILGRGVGSIKHGMPEAYYMCLLHLSDYSKLLALELGTAKASDFKALLDGTETGEVGAPVEPPLEGLLAIEDGVVDDEDADGGPLGGPIDGDDAGFLSPLHLPSHASLHAFSDSYAATRPRGDGAPSVTVHWDNYSHTSLGARGIRRAFIACRAHKDDDCRKYVKESDFPNSMTCCAWLVAWEAHGEQSGCKAAHRWYAPPEDTVRDIARRYFAHLAA